MRATIAVAAAALALTACTTDEPTVAEQAAEPATTPEASDTSPSPEPEPTSEAPEPSPEPTEAAFGSRENPVPLGTVASYEEWDVSIDAVALDAGEEIAAANQFNDEPENGRYVMVTMTLTYTGESDGHPAWAVSAVLVGSDARQYATYDCSAVTPDGMMSAPTLENGGTFTGTDCFDVPPEVLDGAHLFVEPSMSFSDEERAYFQLPEEE